MASITGHNQGNRSKDLIAGLSLFLLITTGYGLCQLFVVVHKPQRWIMVSRNWMGTLAFQRFAGVLLGIAPKVWPVFWALLGMEVASLSLHFSGKKKSYLCRISYLAMWLVFYLLCLLMSDLLSRHFPIFGGGAQPSYLYAPLAFVSAWFGLHILVILLRAFKTDRSWTVLPFVLWFLASAVSICIPLRPWPEAFLPLDFALPLAVSAITLALTFMLWKTGADRLEDILAKSFGRYLSRPLYPSLLLALVLGAAPASALLGQMSSIGEMKNSPNIILITVDTLRADHMGVYGYERSTTPELDLFGREGTIFTNCITTAPYTAPAVWSLMTSKYPAVHGVGMPDGQKIIADQQTLARTLTEAGYRTVAFVSNFVLRRERRFYQGFDIYDDTLTSYGTAAGLPERTADKTTEYALNWLDTVGDERFFLWVHYQDPHGPYVPPQQYLTRFPERQYRWGPDSLLPTSNEGKGGIPRYQYINNQAAPSFYRQRYDGEIAYSDDYVGRLLKMIKQSGLWETSIVILTADHGEAMGEHGYYFGHGHDVTENLIHVPLMIHIPGTDQAERIDEIVSLVDIVPTVLAAVGLEGTMEHAGRNLLPLIEGRASVLEREYVAAEDLNGRLCLRGRTIKYISGSDGERIYDLENDPGEQTNLFEKDPELAIPWRKVRDNYFSKAGPREKVIPQYDPGDIEKLRSLGYLD